MINQREMMVKKVSNSKYVIPRRKITEEFFSNKDIEDKVFVLYFNERFNLNIKTTINEVPYFKLLKDNEIIVFLNNWTKETFEKKDLQVNRYNNNIQYIAFVGIIRNNLKDREIKSENRKYAKWRIELFGDLLMISKKKKE